jgi:hypothetical protein
MDLNILDNILDASTFLVYALWIGGSVALTINILRVTRVRHARAQAWRADRTR